MVAGAALRFATIDLQSYRYDETVTVGRVLHASFFDTFATVPKSESTPPLYYLVAWLWSKPFGTGEIGLRSLSALAGTASIPVIYLATVALRLPRRAGLLAAAIVAVSPVLIWFSQDARAYALVFLFAALSFLFFVRAQESGAARDIGWWAAFSSLALATHYFAGFLLLPEAVLLLARSPNRRRVLAGLAAMGVVAALLLPIAVHQAENAHAGWIAEQSLSGRIERAGAKLIGADNGNEHGERQPIPLPIEIPALLAIASLLLLGLRTDPEERRRVRPALLVGMAGIGLPLLLGLLGADYFDGRNLIPIFVPLIVVLAAGFTVRRAGWVGIALGAAFCLCSLAYTVEIDRLPRLQREDLRHAAREVGPLRKDVALVTIRYSGNQPLRYYLQGRFAKGPLPPLREIDLVGSESAIRANASRLLPPAFRRLGPPTPVSYNFTLARFRAARPVAVPLGTLEQGALVGGGKHASVIVAGP